MKALSLTQPWATAMALGLKQWETRSWPTNFRGSVAIHAAKSFPLWCRDFALDAKIRFLSAWPSGIDTFPLGAIVCVGTITDCKPTLEIADTLSEQERFFGDYSAGRFAFKFELERQIIPPIEAKGALSFWTVQLAQRRAIEQSL